MGKAQRILVVDSEADFVEAARKALEPVFDVAIASNMGEGLLKARRDTPDLVIVGHIEPRGTSFEFHKKLREGRITKDVPLLVVDVRPEEHSRKGWLKDEGMQMDAEDYIARPIEPAELKEIAERIIQRASGKPVELEVVLGQMEQILQRMDKLEGQLVR